MLTCSASMLAMQRRTVIAEPTALFVVENFGSEQLSLPLFY
jgi:hypothetical protein